MSSGSAAAVRRVRKRPERFVEQAVAPVKEVRIVRGRGVELGTIAAVRETVGELKRNCTQLKALHRLLFWKVPRLAEVKSNILRFSGFVYESGGEEIGRRKLEERLGRWNKEMLAEVGDILNVQARGRKTAMIVKIADFLECPHDTGLRRRATIGLGTHTASGLLRKRKLEPPSLPHHTAPQPHGHAHAHTHPLPPRPAVVVTGRGGGSSSGASVAVTALGSEQRQQAANGGTGGGAAAAASQRTTAAGGAGPAPATSQAAVSSVALAPHKKYRVNSTRAEVVNVPMATVVEAAVDLGDIGGNTRITTVQEGTAVPVVTVSTPAVLKTIPPDATVQMAVSELLMRVGADNTSVKELLPWLETHFEVGMGSKRNLVRRVLAAALHEAASQ